MARTCRRDLHPSLLCLVSRATRLVRLVPPARQVRPAGRTELAPAIQESLALRMDSAVPGEAPAKCLAWEPSSAPAVRAVPGKDLVAVRSVVPPCREASLEAAPLDHRRRRPEPASAARLTADGRTESVAEVRLPYRPAPG